MKKIQSKLKLKYFKCEYVPCTLVVTPRTSNYSQGYMAAVTCFYASGNQRYPSYERSEAKLNDYRSKI
jgi:hypothetical protein